MSGIIVQLGISWLIIWIFEKGNLKVLGFYPTKQRLFDFVLFFIIAALCSSADYFLKMYFGKVEWQLNPYLSSNLILSGVWWNIKSVLFEELIFRGALLYILVKKLGATKAIIISAVFFGVYHWFSQEAFGNIQQMAILFLITGIMGLLYAYGYTKTFSLHIPCAIHLGWNLVRSVIFSETAIGDQLLVKVKPEPLVNVSYPVFYTILLLPMVSVLTINFLLLKKRKQIEYSK